MFQKIIVEGENFYTPAKVCKRKYTKLEITKKQTAKYMTFYNTLKAIPLFLVTIV